MEKILKKYRQLLGFPHKEFRKMLRKKVIHRFICDDQFFAESLPYRLPISPADDFRVRLKNELLSKESKPKKSFFRFWVPSDVPLSFSFFRATASVVLSFLVFSTAILLSISPKSRASDNTMITSVVGDVFSSHNSDNQHPLFSGESVGEGMVISTGKYSGATLRFFEDSALRLDENSEVYIRLLDPHPTQNDLGEVQVDLLSGRVWVKTFSLSEEYSRFILSLPHNQIIIDSGGAVDASINSDSELIRSWDRLVRVKDEDNGGLLLAEGRQLLDHFKYTTVEKISLSEKDTAWVLGNQAWDDKLSEYFIEEKMQRKKKEAASKLKKLREAFISPFTSSSDVEMMELESLFFDSLSQISSRFDEQNQDFFATFREKCRQFHVDHPEELEAFFASAEKTLYSVLPDSPFYVAKETLDALKNEFVEEEEQALLIEKERTKRLWEARLLADAGQVAMAEEIIREKVDEIENTDADLTPEILAQRQQQMVALGQMESVESSENVADQAKQELIQKTSALVRPGFPTGHVQTSTEQAHDIIFRVKKYESQRGQENSLRIQLKNMDSIADNIPLLLEVKNRLPDNLKSEVDEKILEILGEEQIKAVDDSLFSIEQ